MSRLAQTVQLLLFATAVSSATGAELPYKFGFAKADVTPNTPLRLSGYGERKKPADGVDEKIFARAMAVQRLGGELHLLVSVDTIGFPGSLTQSIAARIADAHDVPRSRFVLCCTHSHTTPQLHGGLTNLLAVPLTAQEATASQKYTESIADQVVKAAGRAIDDLQPGRLSVAQGHVGFARNRRIVVDGRHSDYGTHSRGPSDLTLPILRITGADGKLRGLIYNYACHCTTFRGSHNRVNGDWAGYASQAIEAEFPGATALCTIGCGADQDPQPDKSRLPVELAKSYGDEIAAEVARLLTGQLRDISADIAASFGYAGLALDRPPIEDFKKLLEHRRPQTRRYAGEMLAVHARMGRLPETYPAPVHVWRFGDELCMVFLGGEVVVDYALRLQKEIDASQVWVSAYCDDVFGYVASERIRREGGYEAVGSTIFYGQPGPWEEGTEELLVAHVHRLDQQGSAAGPQSAEAALETFRLTKGFSIGLVAADPLIADPVNFEVGADGRLWVVEMGDYPLGSNGPLGVEGPLSSKEGSHAANDDANNDTPGGGRVKVLEDVDGDGRYDRSTTFLAGLRYPNGVFPWRDGALVSAGGSILFARDTSGDGRADVIEQLYSGFGEGNPQHRMAGFAIGLDNWLYLSAGARNGQVTSHRTGETIDLAGQDFRIEPTTGKIEPVGGQTQYGRNRDDWGNWFGGDNSRPIWHDVVSDRYLRRNPFVAAPPHQVMLISPEFAPPLFPASRTVDRFNDLFAANRFTSACSPMIFRDSALGAELQGAALICEPVHNLVHRASLVAAGVTFRAERHPSELASELVASTDRWCRPTAAKTGPDGALWIADMYRHVIEHPEWIPEAWQGQLDLRAGDQLGRIYRVFRTDAKLGPIPNLSALSAEQLIGALEHANGWRRDTAQRLLVERGSRASIGPLAELLRSTTDPLAKVHALGTLAGLKALTTAQLLSALGDSDSRVQRHAIELCEPVLQHEPALLQKLLEFSDHPDQRVRLQLAFTLGESDHPDAADALAQIALTAGDDRVLRTAVLSSAGPHAVRLLEGVLRQPGDSGQRSGLVSDLISTAVGVAEGEQIADVLALIAPFDEQPATWQFEAMASLEASQQRRQIDRGELGTAAPQRRPADFDGAQAIFAAARQAAADSSAPLERRLAAVPLMGPDADEFETFRRLLSARQPVELQVAAVHRLTQLQHGGAATLLLASWPSLSPQVQSEILLALLSRATWHERLLTAIEAGVVRHEQLDAATRMRLSNSDDPEIRKRARAALSETDRDKRADVGALVAQIDRSAGDLQRGAKLFTAQCAVCHRHNGLGKDFGPKLAALSDKSTRHLLESILDPNRAMESKYKSYTCLTKDGRVQQGMIVSETSNSITLVQPNGTEQVLLRLDIDQLKASDVSFMPAGLEKGLEGQDFADLFAFIRRDGE